jgi:aminopeptidase-like protein
MSAPADAAPALASGAEMLALVRRLYPICRSITGDGVRETLRIVAEQIPLELREVASGTPVFDWTVPPEWNLRDAWIADARGRRVVDCRASNLHVVSYSTPVKRRMSLAELRPHLHTLPGQPDAVPYRTSYYTESWGFCLSQRQLEALPDGEYEVCIDARLAPGHLSFGECVLPGERRDEILVTTHVCHPSLANDNLSGIAVAAALARALRARRRRLSYRFLFIPGTIGSLTWLALQQGKLPPIRAGLSLVCLGDDRPLTYKRSLAGDALIDRAAAQLFAERAAGDQEIDFFPFGYDERQFNAPGFRLPFGSLMRGRHGQFPEYHTSADRPELLVPARLEDSLAAVLALCERIEGNARYRNLAPYGEPQLGRRGIYRALGGQRDLADLSLAMLWLLSLSDGSCDLLAVAARARLPFALVRQAADVLLEHALLGDSA